MKTLSDYTIYCTESQTKKALELGAPIISFHNALVRKDVPHYYVGKVLFTELGRIRSAYRRADDWLV